VGEQPDDDDFQSAFWNAKRAMMEATEAAFRRHGVRAGQQHILRALWREDCLTPGEIARRLDLTTATVSKMTSRMQATGLVERRPHPSDGRLVRVCLTGRGRALEDVIGQEMQRMTEAAIGTLGPGQRKQLVGYLVEIRRNLEAAAAADHPGKRRLAG
jgi:MarR family transcriptional regulator, organic hydroperoxide resistance regulator